MRRFFLFFLILIFVAMVPIMGYTSENVKVTVKLCNHNTWINGVLVNNINNEFPLIVYNDITYIPMTYSNARFLGLTTNWDYSSGLSISKNNVFDEYKLYDKYINNLNENYIAEIADLKVTVNNKTILNTEERYPLLFFRDITYFPLTWHFAVDEFGWKYSWTQEDGLKINSYDVTSIETFNNILTILNTSQYSPNRKFKAKIILNDGNIQLDNIEGEFYNTFIENPNSAITEYRMGVNLYEHFYLADGISISKWEEI